MTAVIRDPVKRFDRLYNFREIGGLKTHDGRRMKSGVLFRSDELSQLSGKDLEKLKQLNLKSICDLRSSGERKSKPDRFPHNQGTNMVHVPIQDISRIDFLKWLAGKSGSIDFNKLIKDFYRRMAFECTAQINQVITLISDERNLPVLIHCKGGKDRTGYISALIQLLVGVPYQTVLEEYMLSNDLIGPRMKKIERYIRWMTLFQISSDRMKPLLEVRREYLDEIYGDILKKYGSVEEYLRVACGLNQRCISNLQQNLLE
ncbi:tyrosine-protein phosphatase [Paenactinomyces guangxiensis]|uniref:Tyrosine-protein phosphatase n=1 Tax=Paenactinomyces guangxiensis TaxID=1490290 RepID=A0A7W1WN62_9BACL|nr:tyrosine-protein phosphatase [Paenactinomyces guangxiensis]MBA4492838.1 tyrosine-protein phosphatase [Paenactinomyces guangxiensis]MBH8590313.1 tyrosine-protein phosphatase [Paenactinomyces guangxiensis]